MPKKSGIKIVGIVAPTCAGKTSLISELQKRIPESTLATLSLDEYDLFPAGSEAMSQELKERNITNWEDPAIFDLDQFTFDLRRIAAGKIVKLQTRSRESMARAESERFYTPKRINIVEGVFALSNPTARELMDITFYIDIPPDVMVERRLSTLRPGSDGNPWDDPEYVKGSMVEGTRRFILPQRAFADVVLDGLLSAKALADIVMEHLALDEE